MAAIASIPFHHPPVDSRFWPQLMQSALCWLAEHRCSVRDAVVLLPSAAMLPLARAAAAQAGGWMPRIEAVHTLAAALGPPSAPGVGPSGDAVRDRLAAAALLRAQPSWAAWSRRDPRGFSQAVARVVETAHDLVEALRAEPPDARAAWAARARDGLPQVAGPGETERALARVALEWAAVADCTDIDRVHALRPSAWVVLRCGGPHRLAESVLHSAVPGLLIDADGEDRGPSGLAPARRVCEGLEDEAQAATDAVLRALDEGSAPVALIAQDRLLVRRTRALLDRFGLRLRDETGWTLSTTRRAAHLMALLRAAGELQGPTGLRPAGAGADRILDWLKGDPTADRDALAALERAWRRGATPEGAALALLQAARERLRPLAQPANRSLAAWLAALRAVLQSGADWAVLQDDPAGAQMCAVLRLGEGAGSEDWEALTRASRMDLAAFRDWVDEVLEQQNFIPPSDDEGEVDVIVTPAGRSLLRPFAAVVFPGTDERRLGAPARTSPLLPEALAAELGLATAAVQREREALLLRQLLRVQPLVLLRRGSEDGEALSASPLVERALRALQAQGVVVPEEQRAVPPRQPIASRAVTRPAPSAPRDLPSRLSASSVQALRDCPYRFYARAVLGLGEAEELDVELEPRDHGTWLHAVLLQFHRERDRPRVPSEELAWLQQAADAQEQALELSPEQLLPFRAAFASWAPAYVAWLHRREAQGWRWQDGEVWREAQPPSLPGLRLHGRIDRIDRSDRLAGHGESVLQLIDYKTGSVAGLRQRVREPLEDTQLAFYAALLAEAPALQAAYVVLDEREGPVELEHPGVRASAQTLLEGLAGEFERLRAGAGLPALGEGRICETCEARGLCRRDDWGAS